MLVEDAGNYMCQINTDPMTAQTAHLAVMVPPDIDMTRTSGDYYHYDNCHHRYHLCHHRYHLAVMLSPDIDKTNQQWGSTGWFLTLT